MIVATHSPNLSAWVPSKSLVYVRSVTPKIKSDEERDALGLDKSTEPSDLPVKKALSLRPESRCIPLVKLNLTDTDRRKIDRYLDVTKSALLFGGRVLLVEGIAEALLLPVIAKHHVLKNRATDWRKFRSAVFVPIDGVDFVPYVKALLSSFNGVRIADRLVIVTDGDKHTEHDREDSPGEKRKSDLETVAVDRDSAEFLNVFINTYSLETELITAGNAACMKEVYLIFHPRSEAKWDDALSKDGDDRAKSIQELFRTTPKGDFAQLMAEKVAACTRFNVPGYIQEAIEALVK